jgi:hypothetical protein
LSGKLYPLIDNGHGNLIENRNGVPTPKSYVNPVRISTLKKTIQKKDDSGTPVSIEKYYYFMISDYETIVDLRLEFVYFSKTLKVTQRRELKKFSGVIGYEYELKDITEGVIYA